MPRRADEKPEAATESLMELLEEQDEQMQKLFAKVLNLFVAPESGEIVYREKIDRMRKAVDDSLS